MFLGSSDFLLDPTRGRWQFLVSGKDHGYSESHGLGRFDRSKKNLENVTVPECSRMSPVPNFTSTWRSADPRRQHEKWDAMAIHTQTGKRRCHRLVPLRMVQMVQKDTSCPMAACDRGLLSWLFRPRTSAFHSYCKFPWKIKSLVLQGAWAILVHTTS